MTFCMYISLVNNHFFDKKLWGIVVVVSFYDKNKDLNFHLAEFCFPLYLDLRSKIFLLENIKFWSI